MRAPSAARDATRIKSSVPGLSHSMRTKPRVRRGSVPVIARSRRCVRAAPRGRARCRRGPRNRSPWTSQFPASALLLRRRLPGSRSRWREIARRARTTAEANYELEVQLAVVVSRRPHISAGLLDWSRRPNRALKQKVPSSACLLITVCRAKLLDGDVRGTRLLKYVEARG